jgi:hypothetical protein
MRDQLSIRPLEAETLSVSAHQDILDFVRRQFVHMTLHPSEANVGQLLMNIVFVVSQLRCLYSSEITPTMLRRHLQDIFVKVVCVQLPDPPFLASAAAAAAESSRSTPSLSALDQRFAAFWTPRDPTPTAWLGHPDTTAIYQHFHALPADGPAIQEPLAQFYTDPDKRAAKQSIYVPVARKLSLLLDTLGDTLITIPLGALTHMPVPPPLPADEETLHRQVNTYFYLLLWLYLLARRWHWLHLLLEGQLHAPQQLHVESAFPLFPCLVSGHRAVFTTFAKRQSPVFAELTSTLLALWQTPSSLPPPAIAAAAAPVPYVTQPHPPTPRTTQRRHYTRPVGTMSARMTAAVNELQALLSDHADYEAIALADRDEAHRQLWTHLQRLAQDYPNLALLLEHEGVRTLMHRAVVVLQWQIHRPPVPTSSLETRTRRTTRMASTVMLLLYIAAVLGARTQPHPPTTLAQFLQTAQHYTFSTWQRRGGPSLFSFYPHAFFFPAAESPMPVVEPALPASSVLLGKLYHEYWRLYDHIDAADAAHLDMKWVATRFVRLLQPARQEQFWTLWAHLPLHRPVLIIGQHNTTRQDQYDLIAHAIQSTQALIEDEVSLLPAAKREIQHALSAFRFFVCLPDSPEAIGYCPHFRTEFSSPPPSDPDPPLVFTAGDPPLFTLPEEPIFVRLEDLSTHAPSPTTDPHVVDQAAHVLGIAQVLAADVAAYLYQAFF